MHTYTPRVMVLENKKYALVGELLVVVVVWDRFSHGGGTCDMI